MELNGSGSKDYYAVLWKSVFVKASTMSCEEEEKNLVLSFYLYPLGWLSAPEEKKKWRDIIMDDEEVREIVKNFSEKKRKELTSFIDFLKDLEMATKNEKEFNLDKVPVELLEKEVKTILNQLSGNFMGVGSTSIQKILE